MFIQGCTIIFVGLFCLISAAPSLNRRQKRQTIFFEDELDGQGAPNQGTGTSSSSIADKDEWLSRNSRKPHWDPFGPPANWDSHDFPPEHSGKSHHGIWQGLPEKYGQKHPYPHKHGYYGGNPPHGGFPFGFEDSPQFHGGLPLLNSSQGMPSIPDSANKRPVDETLVRVTRQTNNGPTSNNRPTVTGSWDQNQRDWIDIGNGGNGNNGFDFDRPVGNGQNNNGGNQRSNGNGRGTGAWNGNQNWNGNNGWNANQRPVGNGNSDAWNGNLNNGAWNGNGGAWNGNNPRPNGNKQNAWNNNNNGGSWNGNQRPNGNGNNQNSWNNNGGSWNGNNQRPNGNSQNSWNDNNNGGSWNGNQRPNGNANNQNPWNSNNNGGSWNGNNNRPNQNSAGDNVNFGNSISPSNNNNNRPRPGNNNRPRPGGNNNMRPPIAIGSVRPPSTPPPNCDCPATNETNPVCGTDGNTYVNPSRLRCARTCGSDVQQKHFGACTATTPAPTFRRG